MRNQLGLHGNPDSCYHITKVKGSGNTRTSRAKATFLEVLQLCFNLLVLQVRERKQVMEYKRIAQFVQRDERKEGGKEGKICSSELQALHTK